MSKEILKKIIPHLEPHILTKYVDNKPHHIGPGFMSISDDKLVQLGIKSDDLSTIPSIVYDGIDTVLTLNGDEVVAREKRHVFIKREIDKVMGLSMGASL